WDVLSGAVSVSGHCAVIGGGMVGTETAEYLLSRGCQVSIIEMLDKIAAGESGSILPTILADFKAGKVAQYVNTRVCSITAEGIAAVNTVTNDDVIIPCDWVVMAVGSEKNEF